MMNKKEKVCLAVFREWIGWDKRIGRIVRPSSETIILFSEEWTKRMSDFFFFGFHMRSIQPIINVISQSPWESSPDSPMFVITIFPLERQHTRSCSSSVSPRSTGGAASSWWRQDVRWGEEDARWKRDTLTTETFRGRINYRIRVGICTKKSPHSLQLDKDTAL